RINVVDAGAEELACRLALVTTGGRRNNVVDAGAGCNSQILSWFIANPERSSGDIFREMLHSHTDVLVATLALLSKNVPVRQLSSCDIKNALAGHYSTALISMSRCLASIMRNCRT